jgi:hypothetical protein
MKITAEFNSIDELKEFAADFTTDTKLTAKELNESAKKTEEELREYIEEVLQ